MSYFLMIKMRPNYLTITITLLKQANPNNRGERNKRKENRKLQLSGGVTLHYLRLLLFLLSKAAKNS